MIFGPNKNFPNVSAEQPDPPSLLPLASPYHSLLPFTHSSFARSFLGCVSVFAYCPAYAEAAQGSWRGVCECMSAWMGVCMCVDVRNKEREREKVEWFLFERSLLGCFFHLLPLPSLHLPFIYLNRFKNDISDTLQQKQLFSFYSKWDIFAAKTFCCCCHLGAALFFQTTRVRQTLCLQRANRNWFIFQWKDLNRQHLRQANF